jgi:putative (di)nucleoside polyphosphate hydrolase
MKFMAKKKKDKNGTGKKKKMSVDPTTLPYRPCVGVMMLNDQGEVFVARRIGQEDAWQMPQGGIDKGEDALTAGLRELEEEISVRSVAVLAMTDEPLRYDLPPDLSGKVWKGKWRGQEQIWLCVRFQGDEAEINLATAHPEFNAWKWADIEDLPGMIVEFKRPVYEAVVAQFHAVAAQVKSGG